MTFRKKKYIYYLAALIFAFAVNSAHSADQNLFEVSALEVEGKIYGFTNGDFNGDGQGDILIVYSTAADYETRYLGLYLQNGQNRFERRPEYIMNDLPAGAAQINGRDLDGDGKDEIVIIASDGVWSVSFNNKGNFGFSKKRIISEKTIFAFPLFNCMLTSDFLFNLNRSNGYEIIIPTESGYAIYEPGENGAYRLHSVLKAPIACHSVDKGLSEFAYNSGSGLHLELAEIQTYDGNGDKLPDLYFLWDRNICIYFQDTTGSFATDPDVKVNVFSPHTDGFFQSRIADLNGDGSPDLAVSNTTGGITSAETKVRIHMAGAGGRIEQYFRKEITLSDSHSNLMIADFDGNGSPEMAVPAIELGALAVTQMFLMKKADLHLLMYPFVNGTPKEEPSERLKFDFKFDFDNPLPTGKVSLDWSSDFNDDGLLDLVFIGGKGKVSFYWGSRDEYLSDRPDIEINLERASRAYAKAINSGARSDLIIEHRMDGRFDRLTILIKKSNQQ